MLITFLTHISSNSRKRTKKLYDYNSNVRKYNSLLEDAKNKKYETVEGWDSRPEHDGFIN
jgi:hypothetical protein